MESKSPKWGEGKTLIGLFNHPEESARLIIPEDFTEPTDPQSLKAFEEETEE